MATTHQPGHLPWDRNGNRILLQSELGKTKPSTYNLLPEDTYYGKKIYEDPQKANELMYQWKEHQSGPNPNIRKSKDFIETNRKCIKSLLHTATDFSKFRKSSVEFKKVKEGNKYVAINLPEEGFAYGKPLDNEDPIRLVLANTYGEEDKMARDTFYKSQSQYRERNSERKLSFHITKNHNLLKNAATKRLQKFDWLKETPALWKINKFKNIQPKTNTNNDKNRKSSLYRAESSLRP